MEIQYYEFNEVPYALIVDLGVESTLFNCALNVPIQESRSVFGKGWRRIERETFAELRAKWLSRVAADNGRPRTFVYEMPTGN